jgi:hypothetical protein
MKATAEQVAKMFGVPVENVRRTYADNAKELRECAVRAAKSKSRKYRGAAAAEWAAGAEHAETQSKP